MDTSRAVPEVEQEDSLDELKSTLRWAVGDLKWDSKTKKYKKPPICPITGKKLSVSKPGEWVCSYEEALAAQIKYGYDYIGFLLTKDDPYHVTDFDNVIVKGETNPRVMKIIKDQNTYAELSLSGKGLHSIGKARKVSAQVSRTDIDGLSIESYSHARFIIFTGTVINKKPIRDVQEWVDEKIPVRIKKTERVDPSPVDATDEDLLKMALSSKNGEKFKKLFHEGDVSLYKGDHSSADIALCGMLAFWTGKDPTAGCVDIDPRKPSIEDRSSKTFRRHPLYASYDVGQSH